MDRYLQPYPSLSRQGQCASEGLNYQDGLTRNLHRNIPERSLSTPFPTLHTADVANMYYNVSAPLLQQPAASFQPLPGPIRTEFGHGGISDISVSNIFSRTAKFGLSPIEMQFSSPVPLQPSNLQTLQQMEKMTVVSSQFILKESNPVKENSFHVLTSKETTVPSSYNVMSEVLVDVLHSSTKDAYSLVNKEGLALKDETFVSESIISNSLNGKDSAIGHLPDADIADNNSDEETADERIEVDVILEKTNDQHGNHSGSSEKELYETESFSKTDKVLEVFPFVCGFCYSRFNKILNYILHLRAHDETKEENFHSCSDAVDNIFSCGHCKSVFSSICHLHDHLVNTEKLGKYVYDHHSRTCLEYSFTDSGDLSKETVDIGQNIISNDEVLDKDGATVETDINNRKEMNKSLHAENQEQSQTFHHLYTSDPGVSQSECFSGESIWISDENRSVQLKSKDISSGLKDKMTNMKCNDDIFLVNKKSKTVGVKVSEASDDPNIIAESADQKNIVKTYECPVKNGQVKEKRNSEDDDHEEVGKMINGSGDCDGNEQNESPVNAKEESNHLLDSPDCKDIKSKLKRAGKLKKTSSKHRVNANELKSCERRKGKRPGDDLVICYICGQTYKKHHLLKHIGTHSETRDFICDICERGFKTKSQLHNHRKNHVEERNFVCDNCGKPFKTKGNLRQHLLTHTAVKDIPCPFCSEMFNNKFILKAHLCRHSDIKSHICETCGRGFKRVDQLTRHKYMHSDLRPFTCSTCSKAFKSSRDCKKHEKIHQPFGYHCSVCNKGFVNSHNMKTHTKIHLKNNSLSTDSTS